MISRETANTLLEEFARQQEIGPLQLDEDNYCALASADDHVVHLRFDEGQGTFIAFGSIGALSGDEEVALRELRALLTANLMWQDTQGATITLAPESDTVLLQQMWLPEQATADKLDAFLQFNDAEVLQNKGKVTAAIAKTFAESESAPHAHEGRTGFSGRRIYKNSGIS